MLTTTLTRRGHAAPSPAARRHNVLGILTVAAVEAALVALFLLGWTSAVPAPDAQLAARPPPPARSTESALEGRPGEQVRELLAPMSTLRIPVGSLPSGRRTLKLPSVALSFATSSAPSA